jgi:hypothetical protein
LRKNASIEAFHTGCGARGVGGSSLVYATTANSTDGLHAR